MQSDFTDDISIGNLSLGPFGLPLTTGTLGALVCNHHFWQIVIFL